MAKPEHLLPPFHYFQAGQMIVRKVPNFGDQRVLDVRAWGFLTGPGGLGLDRTVAAKEQDAFGEWVNARINAPDDYEELQEKLAKAQARIAELEARS